MTTHHVDGRCPPRVAMASERFPARIPALCACAVTLLRLTGVVVVVLASFEFKHVTFVCHNAACCVKGSE